MGRSRSRAAGRGATAAALPAAVLGGWVEARPRCAQHALALALIALVLACLFPEIAVRRMIFLAADYEAPSAFAAAGRGAPELDDSSWAPVRPTMAPGQLPPEGWPGVGWFRRHLVVDPAVRGRTVALRVQSSGAPNVYLDGQLMLSRADYS